MMNTINSKTSKKGLVEYLKEAQPLMRGKKFKVFADSIKYTLKKFGEDSTQVMRDDLMVLAMDIKSMLDGSAPVPVENSLKAVKKEASVPDTGDKKPKLLKKESAPVDTDKAVEELEKIAKSAKPKVKKTKKPATETPEKTKKGKLVTPSDTPNSDRANVLAKNFPAEFTADGVGKLKVNLSIKTMKDLFEAVQAGKNLIFAFYWTARHLKQFPYDNYQINAKKFKEFPNDLDLSQLVYVSEEHKVAYAVSAYSEVVYSILPADLEMQDGMRFSNGIEFNIYETLE